MQDKKPIKSLIIADLDGEISIHDKEKLYKWISKSLSNTRYYTQIKDLWEASLANASDLAQTQHEWERFNNRIASNPRKKKEMYNITNLYRVAAILVIAFLFANLFIQFFESKQPLYITSIAPKGSVSQTLLPDGTIIYLNAGSELKYDISNNSGKREFFLKGEAWFDVKKNEEKPFIVHTPIYNVEVFGTKFNIKTYKDDETIVTTLMEGSILISSSKKFRLQENILLKPGEQLIYNKISKQLTHREKVDTRIFTSWKENKLIFSNMEFGELLKLLERRSNVQIIVADNSILKEHFSGTFKNETILEILNIIQDTHPISYKVEGQKIIIQKR